MSLFEPYIPTVLEWIVLEIAIGITFGITIGKIIAGYIKQKRQKKKSD